jgi:uncharacterized protein (DUF2062 family)
MAFIVALVATAITNIPIAIVLLYLFNWRTYRGILFTIMAGTVLSVALRSMLTTTSHWQDTFYLNLTCVVIHTAVAYGLIRLKKRMDARAEDKY